jgi:hypothetical protein
MGPDTVTVQSGTLTLKALIWRPGGREFFPAVLFNHGRSAADDSLDACLPASLGPIFAKHGYVFLGDLMARAFAAHGQLPKLVAGRRTKHQVEGEKERLREGEEEEGRQNRQGRAPVLQPRPRRRGPGQNQNREKEHKKHQLRCNDVEHVRPDLIAFFAPFQRQAANRTADAHPQPRLKQRPAAAVRASQQGGPPQQPGYAARAEVHTTKIN